MKDVMAYITATRPISRKIGLLGLLLLLAATISMNVLGNQRAAAASLPTPHVVAAAGSCKERFFFGLKPWYHYMPDELGQPKRGDQQPDPCGIRCFNIFQQVEPNVCGQKASDIPGVILAVVDDLLRIAGLVAVAFILKGSFDYVGSRGNAEKTASAQSTIIAALTGLAVALLAVGLVSFLGNRLGG